MLRRILAVMLIVSLIFTLAACSTSTSSTGSSITNIYTAGEYVASSQGFGGTIEVTVGVDGEKITSIATIAQKETQGVGDKAIEKLTAQMLEKGSADVDVISGATYTSEAFIDAVSKSLDKASGKVMSSTVVNGKYVVDVIGHEGNMSVATMFIDEKIHSVDVLMYGETQGIGSYAVSRIPQAIVNAQSINVDAVSGATITSNVIKQAVGKAIEVAGGNIDDFNSEVERAPIVKEDVEETVQVAIMGAGTAGLYAATKLAEQGITDIILFEKLQIPGGCMPVTYGGIVVTDSQVFNNWGLGNPIYSTWDVMLSAYKARLDAQGTIYDPELSYSQRVFQKSGEVFDWMANNGIGYNTLGSLSGYNSYPYMSPGCYEGGAGFAMEFLVKRLESKGIRIIYDTPVTDFIADENGNITGLIAEGADGKTWTVNAKAVIVASGSFAKNQELIEEHYPEWQNNYFNTIKSVTGDGLILAQKYGAGIENMGGYMPGFMSSYDSKFELAFMHLTTPGMIVNINGNEFGDHVSRNHESMAAAKADASNGDTFYFIFDDAAAVTTMKSKAYGFDTYKAIFEKGEAVKYNSVEECMEQLNLANLKDSIETNNALALAGEVNEWGRKNLPYIETNTGIWAVRVDPNVYLTTGGLTIDLDARVLTQEGDVIKGLYAAGDVCGSVEQKDGCHYGYGFNSALAYGTIAAETIIQDFKLK